MWGRADARTTNTFFPKCVKTVDVMFSNVFLER